MCKNHLRRKVFPIEINKSKYMLTLPKTRSGASGAVRVKVVEPAKKRKVRTLVIDEDELEEEEPLVKKLRVVQKQTKAVESTTIFLSPRDQLCLDSVTKHYKSKKIEWRGSRVEGT